jgi:hypothetical protein
MTQELGFTHPPQLSQVFLTWLLMVCCQDERSSPKRAVAQSTFL